MIFLSIVVPCYKNKDILKYGIPSLERQTDKDFELILIDDKSPNDLYECLDNYVNSDDCTIKNRTRLYKNETNMGPGKTRNRGIELANGKYILFLDDDDYLKEDAVKLLKEKTTDSDIVLYDFERRLENKVIKYHCMPSSNAEIHISEALEKANFSMCSKMYKTTFLREKGLSMPDLLLGEDYVFTKLALAEADSVIYIKETVYVIRDSRESLTKINPLGEFADEQFEYISKNWPKSRNSEALTGIFIYLKCFTRVWNMIEHGSNRKCIGAYIESLDKYDFNWKECDYTNSLSTYQKIFVGAVKHKKIMILKVIVLLRKIAKKVYR